MKARRGSALVTGIFAVVTLSGCGGLGLPPAAPVTSGAVAPVPTPVTPDTGGTPSASPSATPSTAPTGSSSPGPQTSSPGATPSVPDTVARMTGGNGSAVPLLVPTSALPTGWTATKARDTRGYRMTVCGVDLEPTEPVDGAQQNWQASAQGPYLEQHIRVYPDDTAAKVVGALAKKLPGCTSYTAKDTKGQSTFTVERLALKGAPSGTVSWRQRVPVPVPQPATATASPLPSPRTVEVVQDIAVRRSGASIVLLNTYAVGTEPDDKGLMAALTTAG